MKSFAFMVFLNLLMPNFDDLPSLDFDSSNPRVYFFFTKEVIYLLYFDELDG